MNRRFAILSLCVVLGSAWSVQAQVVSPQEELRFVNELRQQGSNDLALRYLERLSKNPPAELAAEMPLEMAKTRLAAAANEPDSTRRLAAYGQAQKEFTDFLRTHPNHPRSAEIKLELAHVSVQRGKAELSQALLQDSFEGQIQEGAKARATLAAAGKELKAAADELDKQITAMPEPKTPAEVAAKRKLTREQSRAQLDMALNLFDQAQTFPTDGPGGDLLRKMIEDRSNILAKAQTALEKIADGDATDPMVWAAKAWLGRCYHELGVPSKARSRYAEVIESSTPAAEEGQRLARYFRLLVIKEKPDTSDKVPFVLYDSAERWLSYYRNFHNTPEGYGIRYLLAQVYLEMAEDANSKLSAAQRTKLLDEARKQVRSVAKTENEFNERAKRLNVQVMFLQKAFDRPIKDLKDFEDCFYRARWELQQLREDEKKLQGDAFEKQRKLHVTAVIEALERGLQTDEVKKALAAGGSKIPLDVNNARSTLTFFYLNEGDAEKAAKGDKADTYYEKAAQVGETFAYNDPSSSQAITAAVYALQAYDKLILDLQEGPADKLKAKKEGMIKLALFMEQRWPKEQAANIARHLLGDSMLKTEKDFAGALQKWLNITPDYNGYTEVQYRIAQAALEAEQNKEAPPPKLKGPDGKPLEYKQVAINALKNMKEPAITDVVGNHFYMLGRARLGLLLYPKECDTMEQIADDLFARLHNPKFEIYGRDDKIKKATREFLEEQMTRVKLYARFGKANPLYKAKKYAEVTAVIDPLVEIISTDKLPGARKESQAQLANTLLVMDLQSNMQIGKIPQAQKTLEALKKVSNANDVAAVLKPLVSIINTQIEALNKKGDKAALAKAVADYSGILQDIKTKEKLTPDLKILLVRAYSGMDKHAEALQLLEKLDAPTGPGDQQGKVLNLFKIRELRLAKKSKEAKAMLDKAIGEKPKPGEKAKPGWGATDIQVLKEMILVSEDLEEYGPAAQVANALVRGMSKKVTPENKAKNKLLDEYLDCYYHLVYSLNKFSKASKTATRRDKYLKQAAMELNQFAKSFPDFGSEESKARFTKLLGDEPELKQMCDKLKIK